MITEDIPLMLMKMLDVELLSDNDNRNIHRLDCMMSAMLLRRRISPNLYNTLINTIENKINEKWKC